MNELWQIAGLFIFSSFKFFLAPPASVIAGYGFISSVLITFTGAATGFIIFFKFWQFILAFYNRLFSKKSKKKRKTFSKKNKFIVKAKLGYGLIGLALLTPCLLGIPLGAILASNYYSNNKKAIPVFLSSILLWSIGLTYISLYIKIP